MIVVSKKGYTKIKLTDKQMSVIMSALAAATMHWDDIKDPEVTTTRDDLINVGYELLTKFIGTTDLSKVEIFDGTDKEK